MDRTLAHSAATFRAMRHPMGGFTIALLLMTALATLPVAPEGVAGRGSRAYEAETFTGAGFDVVVCLLPVAAQSPQWSRPIAPVVAAPEPSSAWRGVHAADVAAGMLNLPPPMMA